MTNLDEKKFHTVSASQKKYLTIIALLLTLVVLPFITFKYYKLALARPAQGFKETTFEIKKGAPTSEIAKKLYVEGLVNSEFLFKIYFISQGLHTKTQAGSYLIPAGSSILDLSEIFQHGTKDVRITFLEGWRAEEFALAASEKFESITYEKFIGLARSEEGYLFPDTYFFEEGVSEEEIISRLTKTYDKKLEELLTEENLSKAGLTKGEATIFASIIEREVADPEDRPIVAGILIKRWNEGKLIGADATTQYAVSIVNVCGMTPSTCPSEEQAKIIDWWPKALTSDDLAFDNPYNTRLNVGLPPAPIANPGYNAIEAVLFAEGSAYNYYLNDSEGTTHFSRTLEEHNTNVSKYLY